MPGGPAFVWLEDIFLELSTACLTSAAVAVQWGENYEIEKNPTVLTKKNIIADI